MIVSPDYKYRVIGGRYYLIPVGKEAQRRETPLELTETAASIWTLLAAGKEKEAIALELTELYEVDLSTAARAVDQFAGILQREGLLSGDGKEK